MKVMITGGTGFIGHNLVLDLLQTTDWEFVVVDMHTYAGDADKLTESPRYDPRRVKIITHDLRKPFDIIIDPIKRLKSYPDVIFNLASNSHVGTSITDPVPFIQSNVAIMTTMLEYAREAKPRLFIQFSTDEVYGPAPQGIDFTEWSTILPSNPYSASKAAQEAIAISYWRTYGVPVVITNCMNVIGPGQYPEKFVPMVIEKLLRWGEHVPVHAELMPDPSPQQFCVKCMSGIHQDNQHGTWEAGSRFYTHVSNVSSALQFITEMDSPMMFPAADRPDRYNIVGNEEVKNDALVDMVAELLGVEPLKTYVDFHAERPGHDRRYALDGNKLEELGWTPPISFYEGLKTTVEKAMKELEREPG